MAAPLFKNIVMTCTALYFASPPLDKVLVQPLHVYIQPGNRHSYRDRTLINPADKYLMFVIPANAGIQR